MNLTRPRLAAATIGNTCSLVVLAVLITGTSQSRQHGMSEPGADEELSDGGSPRVTVYGYDGLPMIPVVPPSPDYVLGHEHPSSPDYVSGLKHPPSHIEPLPADASPTALSPGYVADSDLDEVPNEDLEEDHADYPADGGDGGDEPSDDDDDDDDDDTDDEDEEPFEDEDDDEEEEEHLALADSSAIPVVDPVSSAGDTKAFETDESAPTPRSPQTKVPFAQTHLCRAQKTIILKPPMSASIEAGIAGHVVAPTPPLPISSPLLSLPSPLTTSPTDAGAPLGYRAAGIRIRAASPPLLLPSTSYRTDILEAEMLPRKRACFTTPAPGLEVGESSAAGAARQPGPTLEADLRRGRRVTELATAVRQENKESAAIKAHVRTLEAQFATLIAQTSSLQTQLTITLGRIETLEARDLEP
ncbi:hypothetical protein Tco_0260367 [Tanacetum coccineum]